MQYIISFIFLFGFWFLLSGKTDPFYLGLGAIASLIVTLWSKELLFQQSDWSLKKRLRFSAKFLVYFIWLQWQIILSNIHVTLIAFHPRMKELINPQIVTFKATLGNDEFEQYFLANSITLTPGTITISANKGDYVIHALTDQAAKGVPGDMERMIERLFS